MRWFPFFCRQRHDVQSYHDGPFRGKRDLSTRPHLLFPYDACFLMPANKLQKQLSAQASRRKTREG